MSRVPEVSICVVTFRDRDNVIRCLESIEQHADRSHEVVLVDDASGDGTVAAVRERFPAVQIHERSENGGLVAGRNDAVSRVRGDYVLMLDSDTELRPGTLSALIDAFAADPTIGLAGPRLIGPAGELQLSCRRYPPFLIPFLRRGPYARLNPSPVVHRRHMMMDFDHASERPVAWVSGAAQIWRRDVARTVGPYDRRISSYGGEDLDWCLRVWRGGWSVHYVPSAVVMHHHQQVTRRDMYARSSFRALRDWYYLQAKHWRLRRDPRLTEANA